MKTNRTCLGCMSFGDGFYKNTDQNSNQYYGCRELNRIVEHESDKGCLDDCPLENNKEDDMNNINSTIMERAPMSSLRKTSLVAGLLYLLTFVSIPTLALYDSVRDANYITGPGPDTNVIIGVILEIIVALAGIGTAVTLYPVLRRQNEGVALGLVSSRIVEAGTMFVGAAFLLTVVTLRQSGVGADGLVIGRTLVTLYDRIFLIGQSLMPAVNGLLLGSMLYRSRLVPRVLPIIGFIGAVMLLAGDGAVMFGLIEQRAPSTGLLAIPIAVWEFSLGLYLTFKGFKPSFITARI